MKSEAHWEYPLKFGLFLFYEKDQAKIDDDTYVLDIAGEKYEFHRTEEKHLDEWEFKETEGFIVFMEGDIPDSEFKSIDYHSKIKPFIIYFYLDIASVEGQNLVDQIAQSTVIYEYES